MLRAGLMNPSSCSSRQALGCSARLPINAGLISQAHRQIRQQVPRANVYRLSTARIQTLGRLPVLCQAAVVEAAPAQAKAAIQKLVGGEVFVAGASGQTGARLVRELLQDGFKVTAGVSDLSQAQAVLDFAKRFELLASDIASKVTLKEVDLSSAESIAKALPKRGARVVVVVGDTLGRAQLDAKAAGRVLAAAQEAKVEQFVLVTTLGRSGGGNFLEQLFGGGGGGGTAKLEEEVVNSGLKFAIVRAGSSAGLEDNAAIGGLVAKPQGSITGSAKATRAQVVGVVAQVLLQATDDVVLEVAAVPTADETPIEELIAEVLPLAVVESEEEEDEEEPAKAPEPAPAPTPGPFAGIGTRRIKAPAPPPAAAADEEEDEAPPKPKPAFSFGGLGTRKVKAAPPKKPAAEPEQPKPKPAPSNPFAAFAFPATKKIKAAAEEVEEELEEDVVKPAKKAGGWFGGLGGGAKAKVEEEEEEEEEEEPKKKSGAGLFGFGGGKPKAKAEAAASKAASAVEEAAEKKPSFLASLLKPTVKTVKETTASGKAPPPAKASRYAKPAPPPAKAPPRKMGTAKVTTAGQKTTGSKAAPPTKTRPTSKYDKPSYKKAPAAPAAKRPAPAPKSKPGSKQAVEGKPTAKKGWLSAFGIGEEVFLDDKNAGDF